MGGEDVMQGNISEAIKSLDFIFENTPIKVVANRNCPAITLPGVTLGPFEEGNEYNLQFWVAREMEKSGVTHFHNDEIIDEAKLYKIHWTERVQKIGKASALPENFYPKLRRYLENLKEEIVKRPEKLREYEKSSHMTKDILNVRLKKIISLSSGPAQIEQTLKNFTKEERVLYESLYQIINEWKKTMVEY